MLGGGSRSIAPSDAELDAIGERFVQAARMAEEAGYAFVDVKCCHGYLMHETLGAHTRDGVYGGSFENRTRFFMRVIDQPAASTAAQPTTVPITVESILADDEPSSAEIASSSSSPR